MTLKSWQNSGEVIYGNDLDNNFNGLAAGTELLSGSITAAKLAAEAWSDFTPTPLGYSGTPTVNSARYRQRSKDVVGYIDFTGTSNTSTVKFNLPVLAKNDTRVMVKVIDAGAEQSSPGYIDIPKSTTVVSVYKTLATGGWSTTGTKRIQGSFMYEAA